MHLNFRGKEDKKLWCERCHRCGDQVGTKSILHVSLLYAIFCTQARFGDLVQSYEWVSMQHGHWGSRPSPFQSSKAVGHWRQHVKRAVLVMPSIYKAHLQWLGVTWIQLMWTYTRKCESIDHQLTWYCVFWVMNLANGVILGGGVHWTMSRWVGLVSWWCGTRPRLGRGFYSYIQSNKSSGLGGLQNVYQIYEHII